MQVHESGENYLESILVLREKNGQVRSIDVAAEMGVSKPSVSNAMKKLRQGGYILMDQEGLITLTPAGHEIAARIYERHQLLTAVLISLGVDPENARADACKMEHDLSEESYKKIREHYQAQKK